jgi:hypothetical protein
MHVAHDLLLSVTGRPSDAGRTGLAFPVFHIHGQTFNPSVECSTKQFIGMSFRCSETSNSSLVAVIGLYRARRLNLPPILHGSPNPGMFGLRNYFEIEMFSGR